MKIPASVRSVYETQKEFAVLLKEHVDYFVTGVKHSRWHYESRIKEIESFALKIETGRVPDPARLEDFFACTLVVANFREVSQAAELVSGLFDLHARRPKDPSITHKRSTGFDFDDLRLYFKVRSGPAAPTNPRLVGIVFEMQIKTYLQHAWSIATHDLIYKSDAASWAKERVAYQVKAMLEHAELSISEVDSMAKSPLIALEDAQTTKIRAFIDLAQSRWSKVELPADVRRFASCLQDLCTSMGISAIELGDILDRGRAARGGSHPLNLSPYLTVLQYVVDLDVTKFKLLLEKPKGSHPSGVLIAAELELPDDFQIIDSARVVRV